MTKFDISKNPPNSSISVIILTFNSAATLGQTLRAALQVSDDLHLVDSGSSDNGLVIAEQIIAAANHARAESEAKIRLTITHHPFENYGAQRNWAMENLALRHEWVLNLDADEHLSPPLIRAINDSQSPGFPPDINGYFLPRLVRFLGRDLTHGGLYPTWHMRLFRRQFGRCEARLYDQHFLVEGRAERIHHPMIDDVRLSLSEWTARHNRWSDAEAAELLLASNQGTAIPLSGRVTAKWRGGNPIERKRALRGWYQATPLFLRAFLLFLYRYVVRLGFLDGREGLIYLVLQCFWFRFLVDAKLFEQKQKDKSGSAPS
ncbi:MAG: glycosyltransferase family 2 protein [Alphaproteobacteria bacterium]|nr:glycosyltransferase family 2 protein [Alphaproteobacteria bacterium]